MLPINDIWTKYFEDHHEGLGTTYERFVLHRYFREFRRRYSIKTIVEVPCFGMTGVSGINSAWWAGHDSALTVVDHDRKRLAMIQDVWASLPWTASFHLNTNGYSSLSFDSNSFDMAWNFAAIWFAEDLDVFLRELARITRKILFIVIPNRSNIFFQIRNMGGDAATRQTLLHIDDRVLTEKMAQHDWYVEQSGFLDTPPWPDIAMKKEDFLKKLSLSWLLRSGSGDQEHGRVSILDYFSGKSPDMEQKLMRYSFLEDGPKFIQRIWSHHRFLVFRPRQ